MKTIIDYVREYGGYSFDEYPLTNVDQMIFAMLSYNCLEGYYLEHDTLASITKRVVEKGFSEDFYRAKKDLELMLVAAESVRFGGLEIYKPIGITSDINSSEKIQFGAMIFSDEKRAIVCYRGTDLTFVGWKEDMNMSIMTSIPADDKGLEYLVKEYSAIKGKEIYITGQSKGGHVAVYSYLNAPKEIKSNIRACYNFDGPGFANIDKDLFLDDKIHTIVPETSIVGMLLNHSDRYSVVKSSALLILQHDPYTWYVKEKDFEYTERSRLSIYFDKVSHKWLEGISDERKERFINALFEILSSSDTDSFRGYAASVIKNFPKVTSKINNMDSEDKEAMSFMLKKLGEEMFHEFRETIPLKIE